MRKFIVGLVFLTVGCSSAPRNERNPASALETQQAIVNSGWVGSFTVGGVTHGMRLGFLPASQDDHSFQYFHAITSGFESVEINSADKACEFTPRRLVLDNSFTSGTIHVYPCAANQDEEMKLEAAESRRELAQIPVTKFALSSDGQSLAIEAKIAGVTVRYSLDRQVIGTGVQNSREALRAWVVQ